MKKLNINKKILLIIILVFILLASLIGTFLYIFLSKETLVFKLQGENKISLEVYSEYEELGVIATLDGKDISNEVVIDNSSLKLNSLGTYEIIYTLNHDDKELKLTRIVEIVDTTKPELVLKGDSEITLSKGSVYQEFGCVAVDNYDETVSDKIQVINDVNSSLVGVYEVKYTVTDNSGNQASISRTVVVVEPPKSSNNNNNNNNNSEEKVVDITASMEINEIKSMSFTSDGIAVEGYIKDNNGTFKLAICNSKKKCTTFDMQKKDNYYFSGNVKLSNLDNGSYDVYLESKDQSRAINKQEMQYRIARAKIGDKLVTFSYDKNLVSLKIEDFKYQYDILIDPGHGGTDPGAANQYIDEKNINLIQSQYEKKRYEEHGLKVLLLREDLSYGTVMGDSSWPAVRKKAYALGYYGVVSRISYSNHHNSSDDKSLMGWEIIVPATSSGNFMNNIYKIRDAWKELYPTNENHVRIYTRNYNTNVIFTKENNEQYYFTDYYAVIRIPYQLYNVNNVLFEGSYLSNLNDYDWYYNNGNWKKLSEEKIKTFVTSLGKEYIPPQEDK